MYRGVLILLKHNTTTRLRVSGDVLWYGRGVPFQRL